MLALAHLVHIVEHSGGISQDIDLRRFIIISEGTRASICWKFLGHSFSACRGIISGFCGLSRDAFHGRNYCLNIYQLLTFN